MMRVCLMDLFLPCRALELVRRNYEYTGQPSSGLCQPITDEHVSTLSAISSCFPYLMKTIAATATRTNTAALVSLVPFQLIAANH